MRRAVVLLSLLLMFAVHTPAAVGDGVPWPAGWTHVGMLIVHNPGSVNLYNVTVPVTIDFTEQVNRGYVRTDLADVRFTDASGSFIPYNYTGQTGYTGRFLVKFPVLAPGDNAFYVFYGNPGAYYASFNETFNETPVNVTVYDYPLTGDPGVESYRYVNESYLSISYTQNGLTASASGGSGVAWVGFPRVPGFSIEKMTVEATFSGSGAFVSVGFNADGYTDPYAVDGVSNPSSDDHAIEKLSSLTSVDYSVSYGGTVSPTIRFTLSGGSVYDEKAPQGTVSVGYDAASAAPGIYLSLRDGDSVTVTGFKVTVLGYPGYTVLLDMVPGDIVYQPEPPEGNVSATGNVTVGGWSLSFPSWLENYKGSIALLIAVVPLLLATEGTAGIAVAASAGLLGVFAASGWTSLSQNIIGLALVAAGIGLALQRKNS